MPSKDYADSDGQLYSITGFIEQDGHFLFLKWKYGTTELPDSQGLAYFRLIHSLDWRGTLFIVSREYTSSPLVKLSDAISLKVATCLEGELKRTKVLKLRKSGLQWWLSAWSKHAAGEESRFIPMFRRFML